MRGGLKLEKGSDHKVDLDLTNDQELFLETSTRFIEASHPLTTVREGIESKSTADEAYRRQAGELGWYGLMVPEELGGGSVSGNGVHDAALIGYRRGAFLQPGTFVGTNVVTYALATGGTEEHQSKALPALLSGEDSATWAVSARTPDGSPDAGVSARRDGDGYRLTGSKTLVQDAHDCDWILLTAAGPERPIQFLLGRDTAGLRNVRLNALDLTRQFCDLIVDDVWVPASAQVGGEAGDLVERELQLACVLTVAESLGAMDHDFELALQYAKDRIAFGRPIGSFQAVKHQLADTSLMLEMCKGVGWAAAQAVGRDESDAGQVASMAKAYVGDCSVDLAQNCFQTFGGIGYTWEHDQHLYLRRLTMDAALYGAPAWHRERLCQLNGL